MLTSKIIRALKPKETRYQITDYAGLALRVQRSGVKSWVLRVPQSGRIHDITLGHWPEISLMQARALARRKRRELELEPSGSYTFRDAFKFWCSKKKNRIASYRDEKLRLEKYIISKLGSRQLDSITPPVLIKLLEPVETAGKLSTVKRLLCVSGKFLIWPLMPDSSRRIRSPKLQRFFRSPRCVTCPHPTGKSSQ